MVTQMKNKFSKNIVIATMTFVGIILLVSTIINSSSSNMSVNAQQQSPKTEALEKGTIFVFNEKSRPANEPEKCAALASVVKGKAVPDYNLCDIVVYRQAPPIVRNDGMVLNNFSGLGHYIEMVPAVVNNTGTFNSKGTPNNQTSSSSPQKQDNLKVAFGEWSVIDAEVAPVQKVMQKYNWTQTALHHHMLNESPKILFLHWSVTGDANELIKQAKEIIMQTSTYQNLTGNTRTPTSGGP